MQNTEGATMKIRIGDRVRIKSTGEWGTVVRCHNWSLWRKILMCLLVLDTGVYVDRTKRQLEKLPRYRGYPQARDMKTAMRHLQEYLK
jgi:hypothetical protein